MTKLGFQLRRRRAVGGIALAEAVVAAAVTVIALGGFSASTQQAARVVRMGKEVASEPRSHQLRGSSSVVCS
jgi:hypothetical protein